jgi:CrcB protein
MDRLIWLALGGAAGTVARYGVTLWSQQRLGADFPYGTLAVNLAGSFLLGAVMEVGATTELLSPTARLALGIGVMGGFTTYSSFSYETFRFFQNDAWVAGIVNALATFLGCLLATALGVVVTRRLVAGG